MPICLLCMDNNGDAENLKYIKNVYVHVIAGKGSLLKLADYPTKNPSGTMLFLFIWFYFILELSLFLSCNSPLC